MDTISDSCEINDRLGLLGYRKIFFLALATNMDQSKVKMDDKLSETLLC